MKTLQLMINILHMEQEAHKHDTYNYVIPESWNHYGFQAARKLRDKQLIVNPYAFYAYTLDHIFTKSLEEDAVQQETDTSWIRSSTIYSFMVRTASAWDHDRDDRIDGNNLYHLRDNGTFLKSIALLPLLKRMGINTLLLHQPFTLGKTQKAHNYASKDAIVDFQKIDESLADPLVKGMSVNKQFQAFIEACHQLNMRVILEYCPGKMARHNAYVTKHPDWFYWIDESYEKDYHAPICHGLPQNTLPFSYTLKDLYKSEDVLQHIEQFKVAPSDIQNKCMDEIKAQHHMVCAPTIVDQINANIMADYDTTILRFYDERIAMVQDAIRPDLNPGKKAIRTCWNQVIRNVSWFQKTFHIDGIYIASAYLLPEKLQMELAQAARKDHPSFVMIAEDAQMENSEAWIKKGYDMISGNSGYEESNLWEYKFHAFAYRLKGNACPMFAASEFYDSRRISSLENGKQLAIMLTVMNHFLPNGIPMMMNGIESFDVQPMQLSPYGDNKYLYSLSKEDPRYRRQSYLDEYYFDYCSSQLSLLPNILETISHIRSEFMDAICNPDRCIPVWFDSPQDPGIGFTFVGEHKALMVICNINIHGTQNLHAHSDNLFPHLPFTLQTIKQIYSTQDPYVQVLQLDTNQNLSLAFAAGEVKFIVLE